MKNSNGLSKQILLAMITGAIVGIIAHQGALPPKATTFLVDTIMHYGGKIFIDVLKVLVVPVVFVSLAYGTTNLGGGKTFGKIASKTIALYLFTTAVAVALAISIATLFNIGATSHLAPTTSFVGHTSKVSFTATLSNIFLANPLKAFSGGNMMQLIVIALLTGFLLTKMRKLHQQAINLFEKTNTFLTKVIHFVIKLSPYGIFCLIGGLFAKTGFEVITNLLTYFVTVLGTLFIHWAVVYGALILFLIKMKPWQFYRKIFPALLLGFSTSSSNATLPVTLDTAKNKLGIKNSIASFVIPLGATINMDGTAIMQGVATVFIANLTHVTLTFGDYITIIGIATAASIGTAGIPAIGLITLVMVLNQLGLDTTYIAYIIGVDRLLDMTRTAVNISGDCVVANIISKSEDRSNQ